MLLCFRQFVIILLESRHIPYVFVPASFLFYYFICLLQLLSMCTVSNGCFIFTLSGTLSSTCINMRTWRMSVQQHNRCLNSCSYLPFPKQLQCRILTSEGVETFGLTYSLPCQNLVVCYLHV